MVLDTWAVLVLSVMLVALGASMLRHWRMIGEYLSQFGDPRLLFGPWGERVLVPASFAAILAGVAGAAQALLSLSSMS